MLEAPSDKILQEDLEWIAKKEENLHDCTVFVTGATGLIGSLIVKSLLCKNRLKNSNIKVIALARSAEKVKKKFKDVLENKDLKIVYGDILAPLNIEEKIDYVIHAASRTASKDFVNKPVETIDSVVNGTKNILDLVKNKEVKSIVYLSTMEIYGIVDFKVDKIAEDDLGYIDILKVRSSYPESKRLVENLCIAYYSEYKLPVKIARLAQTFGPGVVKDDNRVFAQFARSVINKEDIILHTDGESIRNYCYIRDAILGIFTLLNKGEDGEAYTISNEESCISIKKMAEMVAEKIAKGDIKVVIKVPEDIASYGYAPKEKMKLSSKKIQSLGWKAEVSLEESYRRMIESMTGYKEVKSLN
ncbi:dTDP-glucose 4,6-dehydratase [Clostridium sp. DSM 8431]|nr:dTDP-glucose 4,6-dehydratase [Clostridium sp. DSM 8431]